MAHKKVLIVDDDPDIQMALSIRLRAQQYETVLAADAIMAVGLAQREKPDLILLDIGLPGGDGFRVMGRLRELPVIGMTPVIVISARDPSPHRAQALAAGAVAYFQKPIDHQELLAKIAEQWPSDSLVLDSSSIAAAKPKILIIDDDPDLQMAMCVRLRAHHYETVVAGDAIMAINVAQREKPDLILLDLGLPCGDGFTVMERMKDILPLSQTPIIVMTGRDPQRNSERAKQVGARAFLQKPVDNDLLLETIRGILHQESPGQRAA